MADTRLFGTCKHCKQTRIITPEDLEYFKELEGEDYEPTQAILDELASLKCDCDDAKRVQRIDDIRIATKDNINMLFGKDFTDEAEAMCALTDLMTIGKISKISLQLRHSTKASMTRTVQGDIKVKKVVTDTDELYS